MNIKAMPRLVILVFCVCFISLPVLSGENPWDADDDWNKYDERYVDTSLVIRPYVRIYVPVTTSSSPDWFTDVVTTLSFKTTRLFISDYDVNLNNRIKVTR